MQALLGIYEVEKDNEIDCPGLKNEWVKELFKRPYSFDTKCKEQTSNDRDDCVKSKDLSSLFGASFNLIKEVLARFGFNVSVGQLGYNKTILSVYNNVYSKFPFILDAVDRIDNMITEETKIDHELLVKTSDTRINKCEDLLNMKDVCKTDGSQETCLSPDSAQGLLNYVMMYNMIDSKQIISEAKMKGILYTRLSI